MKADLAVTSSPGRGGTWGGLALRAVSLALLLASLWLFLSYLARCDREGRKTLFQLSAPMAALLSTGAFLERAAAANTWLVRFAVLALAVAGTAFLTRRRRGDLRLALGNALGLSFLALSTALFLPPPLRPLAFLAGLAAGLALLLRDEPPGENPAPGGRAVILVPLGIAAALRFFALAEVPRGFSDHPAFHHAVLTFVFLEKTFPLLSTAQWEAQARWIGQTLLNERLGLTCFLDAIGFKLLGVSFVTARLISATAGCLSVLAAYFLGARLQGRRLGLLFSFLLAVSPWHVSVSRYGDLEHVVSPLQLLLALGFYAAAVRSGRLRDYVLTAGFLGLSWFVYPPNLVVPIVVGFHLVFLLASDRAYLRRDGWKVATFALLFGLISYAPVSRMLHEGLLMPGARTGYQGTRAIPLTDADRNWRMLVSAGKQLFVRVGDPWFGKPGGGASLTETALFLPGILLCAGGLFVRSRRWSSSLVLLALPLSVVPGLLAPEESFRRLLLTATLALLLASLVLSRVLDALAQLGLSKRSRLFAFGLFAVAIGAVNAHVYFERVNVDSEEGAIYLTQMSTCVKTSLGREFVYVYTLPGTDSAYCHRYIRLAAYEPLRELSKRGLKREDLYEIVSGADLLAALKKPRRIQGGFRILAEESLLTKQADSLDVRGTVLQAFPQTVEESIGPAGKHVVRSWRIR
jgi:hypothetical protein